MYLISRCFYWWAIKKSQKSLASLTQLFWDRLLDKGHFFVVDKVNGIWGHKLKSCIFYDIRQICYVRSPLCIYSLGQFCSVSKCGVSSKRNKTRPTETIKPSKQWGEDVSVVCYYLVSLNNVPKLNFPKVYRRCVTLCCLDDTTYLGTFETNQMSI